MMPIYTDAIYRAGYQLYLGWVKQTAHVVALDATSDPTPPSGATTLGLCRPPALEQAENFMPVESIGAMRDVSFVPGRREPVIRSQIAVSDFSAFANAATTPSYVAIRNHTTPSGSGLVNGLQLVTLHLGAGTAFGTGMGWAGVDSLCNSLRVAYAEGQPVTADVEFWPLAVVPVASPYDRHSVPTGTAAQPLVWQQLTWQVGSTDYKPILAGVTIAIANNLQRIGSRPVLLGQGGAELAISRCAYRIIPGLEKLQVSYQLHDRLPAALEKTSDWGQVVLRAEQPGTGAGRCYLQITIDHSFLNRVAMPATGPGQQVTFTADVAAFAVSMDAGYTTG